MPTLQALCPNCGPVDSQFHVERFSRGANIFANVVSCPNCGTPSALQDVVAGVPQPFIRQVVEAVRTSTDDELTELRRVLRLAQAGDRAGAHDEAETSKLNPVLRKVVIKALEFGLLGLLATAVQIWIDHEVQRSSDDHEAAVLREMRRQSAQNELILQELGQLSAMDKDAAPPRQTVPAPRSPRRPPLTRYLSPDDFRDWWNRAKEV